MGGELEVKVDYLEQAARRMGRVDWWNLFAGALMNLVLTGLIPPHGGFKSCPVCLRPMASPGLFGVGPPELLAQ